jgi:hypothetical protein
MELLIYAETIRKNICRNWKRRNRKKSAMGVYSQKVPRRRQRPIFCRNNLPASKISCIVFSSAPRLLTIPEISRFLYSIEAGGKPIFINDSADKNAMPATTVSTTELKTSPEIMTALSQKSEKSDRKITYEFKTVKLPETAFDF